MKNVRKVRASVYVLVLVLMLVATTLVVLLFSNINLGFLQFGLEKQTRKLEGFVLSALDRATTEFLNNPNAFLTDPDQKIYFYEYDICGPTGTFPEDKKCDADSVIKFQKFKKIIGYMIKNGETIQATISPIPNPSVGGTPAWIEIHFTPNTGGDTLLVTGYYMSGSELKIAGACTIRYATDASSVSGATCLGNLVYRVYSPSTEENAQKYGTTRVLVRPGGTQKISYYRVTYLTKSNEPGYLSITGSNYADMPLEQQIVFKAIAYSVGDPAKRVKVAFSRSVMINPAVPEVFDWVLYNGSSASIVK